MKYRWFLFLCIFAILAISAFAQTRTVTNFELEKYRTQRVQAETDLRENYAKLGFSSPVERAKRDEAQRKENQQLAERFERERLEQESADAAARQAAYGSQQTYGPGSAYPVLGNDGYYYSYGNTYGNRNRFRGGFRQQGSPGYFAGGAFWPTPSGGGQPIFIVRPPVRPRH